MKTLDEIKATLDAFTAKYGIDTKDTKQGSETWFKLKLGVISASNAYKAVSAKDTDRRADYMADLVAQVCTGIMEEITSKHMDHGNQFESAARSYYAFQTGYDVVEVPFVFKDDTHREGCSPDLLIAGLAKGSEIKCPWNTKNYILFMTEGSVKPEWKWQNQFTMRVTRAEEWDFNQYDPRMSARPMTIKTVKRDAEMQKKMDDLIPEFIHDMDLMLKEVGVEFGSQWRTK